MSASDAPDPVELSSSFKNNPRRRTQEELDRIDEDFVAGLRRHIEAGDVARMCGEGHAP